MVGSANLHRLAHSLFKSASLSSASASSPASSQLLFFSSSPPSTLCFILEAQHLFTSFSRVATDHVLPFLIAATPAPVNICLCYKPNGTRDICDLGEIYTVVLQNKNKCFELKQCGEEAQDVMNIGNRGVEVSTSF
jgi:hypothetical protein